MSRLTQSQLAHMIDAQEALEARAIVLLKGKPDGKTRIAYELQEAIATRTPEGRIRSERRHAENSQIEFLPELHWPRGDVLTLGTIARQIVQHFDGKTKRSGNLVLRRLMELLKEFRAQNRILAFTIDNAELLSVRAFTVIKAMNELRDRTARADIGIAALLSGNYAKITAAMMRNQRDTSFLKHCTEIRVGKITTGEIGEIIATHYPTEAIRFEERALERLAQLETTLDVHAAIRNAVMLRKERRAIRIDVQLMDKVLA